MQFISDISTTIFETPFQKYGVLNICLFHPGTLENNGVENTCENPELINVEVRLLAAVFANEIFKFWLPGPELFCTT